MLCTISTEYTGGKWYTWFRILLCTLLYTFRCILFVHTLCVHVYIGKKVFIPRYTIEYTRVYNNAPEIGASVYLVFKVYNKYTTVYNRCTICLCTHRYTHRYTVQSTQTLEVGHIRFAYPMYTLKLYTVFVYYLYTLFASTHIHICIHFLFVYTAVHKRYAMVWVKYAEVN